MDRAHPGDAHQAVRGLPALCNAGMYFCQTHNISHTTLTFLNKSKKKPYFPIFKHRRLGFSPRRRGRRHHGQVPERVGHPLHLRTPGIFPEHKAEQGERIFQQQLGCSGGSSSSRIDHRHDQEHGQLPPGRRGGKQGSLITISFTENLVFKMYSTLRCPPLPPLPPLRRQEGPLRQSRQSRLPTLQGRPWTHRCTICSRRGSPYRTRR